MSTVQQTLSKLRELKLNGMAEAYMLQTEQPKINSTSFDDRLSILVDHEMSCRDTRRLQRLIRNAGFREQAALEDLDDRATRAIDKALLSTLASCQWVHQRQNLIIQGATGVGKTWLGCALGTQACRLGLSVLYQKSTELYLDISTAIHTGSLPSLKKSLIKPEILMIDDFGYGEITPEISNVLLDVIDRRMKSGSLIITSQYPKGQWHSYFPDPTLADAILDRIVHLSHLIHVKGESMRKILAKKRMPKASALD